MRIDPHTHSTCSDGTDTPTELMEAAAAAGLDVLGLTDHDTTAGWDQAARAVATTGVSLLRGIEISCSASGITLHLLAYLADPDDADLTAALERARRSREDRSRQMVERLAADYPITWADVCAQAGGDTVGRPHIADALVAAGCFPDRSAAFSGPLATSSPYYVRYWALDPVRACELVRGAGGVPVAAHPRAGRRQRYLVPDAVFGDMADAGLAAIEVNHPEQNAAERAQAAALAARYGLAVSGASDYHGTGKPNRLGQCLMDPALLEQIRSEGSLELLTP